LHPALDCGSNIELQWEDTSMPGLGGTRGTVSAAPVQRISGAWRGGWPNPADLNFDYHMLLEEENNSPIAQVKDQACEKRIAIVGAGIAGATAARELVRCGFRHVHLFEATDRIGGRLYSRPVNYKNLSGTPTVFELGAMRIPFFPTPGSKNSLTDYYVTRFDLKTQPFPNPGAKDVLTAVYMNDGLGPDPRNVAIKPLVSKSTKETETQIPDDPLLRSVSAKWRDFKGRAESVFRREYQRQQVDINPPWETRGAQPPLSHWQRFWRKVEEEYYKIDFRELVTRPGIMHPERPWDFGGMGMTSREADVFATIGAGDGGWGPFYDVSALWVIRTLLFGYANDLRLIVGKTAPGSEPAAKLYRAIRKKHKNQPPELVDSWGGPFSHPIFLGVQSIAECMIFDDLEDPQKPRQSFYGFAAKNRASSAFQRKEHGVSASGVALFMNTEVFRIKREVVDQADRFRVFFRRKGKAGADAFDAHYDYVIVTAPSWAVQQLIDIDLGPNIIPKELTKTLNSAHWIASKKVFFPLKRRFWTEKQNIIPQVWVTDNLLQGVYAYSVAPDYGGDNGAILISYTWEDDALKLLSDNEEDLKRKCIFQFDKMLKDFGAGIESTDIIETTRKHGKDEIDYDRAFVFEWLQQPTYRGCAKLYRAVTYRGNYEIARHNQERGTSGLLFAGSSYTLDDGWMEPAMRLAIDAVLRIARNHNQNGSKFKQTFDWERYSYYPEWGPLPEPIFDDM
jgi:tryptophan 2-monooxygenase